MAQPERANATPPLPITVARRRLVKASDPSLQPHVLAVSNLDLIPNAHQSLVSCVYPKPLSGDFGAVVAAFEAHLPSFLNYFFPLAGRIVVDPSSGLPEIHCLNQGAELVVGEASVALGSLDWGRPDTLKRIHVPYADELPLSVQLLSFACGGFAVVWATNMLIGDGSFESMLVRTWSEMVRTGAIASGDAPNHDRSVFRRPRDPPSYGEAVARMFTVWDGHEQQVGALSAAEAPSFVDRLYYIEERDVARLRAAASAGDGGQRATRVQAVSAYLWKLLAGVAARDGQSRCQMMWWVDGRRRLSSPELRSALRCYVGSVMSSVAAEEDAETVLRRPLPEVAAMVRDAIASPNYDELFQELVDFVEVHKPKWLFEAPLVGDGLGGSLPTVALSMWTSFVPADGDFGFGPAALILPVNPSEWTSALGAAVLHVAARPGDSGSWIVQAESMSPGLAAALEDDEERVFKPLTAEYLGLSHTCHLLHDETARV
ncbi:hypothetical protein ACP70R_019835 [Stipagrostis hirtigluma subsp. patula]